ncbi:MAG: type II methionyl aminopeptidase [Methanobacteriota archaeon]
MNQEDVLDAHRKAGAIARKAREMGLSMVKPGVRYLDLAETVEKLILDSGARLAFPVNIAVDDVAAHYTPVPNDKLAFSQGQIVKLDVGTHIDGCIADTAATVETGTNRWSALIEASRAALDAALDVLAPGVELRKVGGAVERTIEARGFRPISNLCGHSVAAYDLHAGHSIPNVMDDNYDTLSPGTVVAVEPFATNGAGHVSGKKNSNIYRLLRKPGAGDIESYPILADIYGEFRQLPFSERWCAARNPKSSAQLAKLTRKGIVAFYPMLMEARGGMVSQAEHTVIITEDGNEVIT